MLSNRRNGVETAPEQLSMLPVPASVAGVTTPSPISRSPVGALDAAVAGRAGIPPAAGVPKSVKIEKIWLSIVRIGRSQADDRAGIDQTGRDVVPLIVVATPTTGKPRFGSADARRKVALLITWPGE